MDGKTFARVGAVAFVGVAITATIVERTRKEEEPTATVTLSRPDIDPRRATLRQCRDMGEAATRDPVCLRAWAENRLLFLGQNAAPALQSEPAPPEVR
jgi:conjugative transfer region protein TrbK